MIIWSPNFIGPGITLLVMGLVAVLVASLAAALIKAIGYVVMIGGVAAMLVGLVKRLKRPWRRRTMAQ